MLGQVRRKNDQTPKLQLSLVLRDKKKERKKEKKEKRPVQSFLQFSLNLLAEYPGGYKLKHT